MASITQFTEAEIRMFYNDINKIPQSHRSPQIQEHFENLKSIIEEIELEKLKNKDEVASQVIELLKSKKWTKRELRKYCKDNKIKQSRYICKQYYQYAINITTLKLNIFNHFVKREPNDDELKLLDICLMDYYTTYSE